MLNFFHFVSSDFFVEIMFFLNITNLITINSRFNCFYQMFGINCKNKNISHFGVHGGKLTNSFLSISARLFLTFLSFNVCFFSLDFILIRSLIISTN